MAVGTNAFIPGIMPSSVPTNEPRSTGAQDRFMSSRDGISEPTGAALVGPFDWSSELRISLTPNRPIATGTMLMPASSEVTPKVNRGAPTTGSIPTNEIISPKVADIRPRISDRPASAATSERPIISSAKNSGGPKPRANFVSGRASITRQSVAMVPPVNEPSAATARAGPARPFLAMA